MLAQMKIPQVNLLNLTLISWEHLLLYNLKVNCVVSQRLAFTISLVYVVKYFRGDLYLKMKTRSFYDSIFKSAFVRICKKCICLCKPILIKPH